MAWGGVTMGWVEELVTWAGVEELVTWGGVEELEARGYRRVS